MSLRLRWWRRRRRAGRRVEYDCSLRDCTRPAEPWDGPFCTEHGWADYRAEQEASGL